MCASYQAIAGPLKTLRDGLIIFHSNPRVKGLIVGINKECMECNFFAHLETHLTIDFSRNKLMFYHRKTRRYVS